MHVVATAGHVDHGKSTLVRALTGMEPDRWAEERRRGMTIDLGFAWTVLPGRSEQLEFVDVPGHQRFIGNMLAGLGPAPAVMFVVAADESWRRQSEEHLAAVDALGLTRGLLVVTRSDLADPGPALEVARARLARSSLGTVEAVAASGLTGAGLADLRAALGRLIDQLPPPVPDGRIRLWVDRSFSVRGAGTVVTGTLGAGTLHTGDELEAAGRTVRIRGLEVTGRRVDAASAVARVGVNLRGVAREDIRRGDVLVTPGAWRPTTRLDVRLTVDPTELPGDVMLHVGTAGVPVHVRPLSERLARLTLPVALPLVLGDRALLRDPGRQSVAAGVEVLDADPPSLRRRGAAAVRAAELAGAGPDAAAEVHRRGAVTRADLERLGVDVGGLAEDEDILAVGDWLVSEARWSSWVVRLLAAVDRQAEDHPLTPQLSHEAARRALELPGRDLLAAVVRAAGLVDAGGRITRPGRTASLGSAEPGLQRLEARLAERPFDAPSGPELEEWRLGPREIATAVSLGRLVRVGDVVLAPDAAARAVDRLRRIDQPFTTSAARKALDSTRRTVIPLLEHLDAVGATEWVDAGLRRIAD